MQRTISNQRAMVVDDDPIFRYAFARQLTGLGWKTYEAEDGEHALAGCKAIEPRIVFLDLQMPGRDGFEVCEQLRKESSCADALIVAVSGVTRNFFEERALSCGFDLYLLKPVSKELLSALLESEARRLLTGAAGASGAQPRPSRRH